MKATIGDILLFKISDRDFGIFVPLLVTWVDEDGSVSGTIFFDWEKHRRMEWPAKKIFWGLSDLKWYVPVSGAKEGGAIGTWKFKDNHLSVLEKVPPPPKAIATPLGQVKAGAKK